MPHYVKSTENPLLEPGVRVTVLVEIDKSDPERGNRIEAIRAANEIAANIVKLYREDKDAKG